MNKVLFLEDEKYLLNLGVFENCACCDGTEDYKILDSTIKKYDLVISQLYTSPLSNFLIIKAKNNNVKTMLLCDGVLEWANCFTNPMNSKYNLNFYHPILHDMVLSVGNVESKYFKFLGFNSKQYVPKRMKPTMDKIGKVNKNRLLITTANTAYYNNSEKLHLVTLIKDVQSSCHVIQLDYIFRLFDDELINLLGVSDEKNHINGSFEECLTLVDFVVSTPSSISISAMFHGKPLGHLIYRDAPMFVQAGWNISSSIDIDLTLKHMISFNKERLDFQDFQVSNYITDDMGLEEDIFKELSKQKSEKIEKFINQNLYNMLNSKFNFNIEYSIRKLYLSFKSHRLFKVVKKKLY